MKKIQISILALVTLIIFSGCVGVVTKHEYRKGDFVILYKVVKSGVTTFMTAEQIEAAKLDKVNIVVTDTYKLVEGNDVDGASTVAPNTK